MRILHFSIIITSALISYKAAVAQQNEINTRFTNHSLFLFNTFETGIAYFDGGGTSEAKFNYNVVHNEFCYLNNNQVLVISNLEELDSIQISNKVFKFIDNKALESIHKGKISVLLSRNADLSAEKPAGAYGTSSNTSAVSKKTSIYAEKSVFGGELVNLQNQEDKEIAVKEKLYLYIGNDLFFARKSRVLKKFRTHKSDIKNFIREKEINLQNEEDLIELVSFLERFN